jgi:hypothetical protein
MTRPTRQGAFCPMVVLVLIGGLSSYATMIGVRDEGLYSAQWKVRMIRFTVVVIRLQREECIYP